MRPSFENFIQVVSHQAATRPEHLACTYLTKGSDSHPSLTYAALDREARIIAQFLLERGLKGQTALLLYRPGLDFVKTFFGCLYAGVIAVPVYPPKPNQSLDRLQKIVENAASTCALTTSKVLSNLRHRLHQFPLLDELHWTATDHVQADPDAYITPNLRGSDLAMLQYTSGSTSMPKGVMVSHENILWNQAYLQASTGVSKDNSIVSWLPLFHDMGLFGCLLNAVYAGATCHLLSPITFLQNPLIWLQQITETRAYFSGGPNFAFDLCAQRATPENTASLDLSHWHVAFCGAEPIRPETFQRFQKTFADCGLQPQALFPSYGLAEATLFVAANPITQPPLIKAFDKAELERHRYKTAETGAAQSLVGCGHPPPGVTIRIVQPDSQTLAMEGQVGEIWVKGKHIAQGYLANPEATQHTFGAMTRDTQEGPFLRTGDLGFIDEGELFVTGRTKDVIIIRGANYYPQDIEAAAFAVDPLLRLNRGAAFATHIDGEEQLALALELNRGGKNHDLDDLILRIRNAINDEFGLEPVAVALLRSGRVSLTSSGKIQRSKCRAKYEAGDYQLESEKLWQAPYLRRQNEMQPPTNLRAKVLDLGEGAIKQQLVALLAETTGIVADQIAFDEPFSKFGLDSLKAATLSGRLQEWLETDFPPTLFYEYPTVAALAQHLSGRTPTKAHMVDLRKPSFYEREPIAVVGMACRFPKAEDTDSFWQLLTQEQHAIRHYPEDRPRLFGEHPLAGYLDDISVFDAHFFKISPREAEQMDPQQRILLEVAWQALETAGIAPRSLEGSKTGVFIGISTNDYQAVHFQAGQHGDPYSGTGLAKSIAANRLSYFLDLRGPSLSLDTACSSSLVALHHACESIHNGQSTMALAGGVNVLINQTISETFRNAGMLAPDGLCKTFDAKADGYVRGEGCGVVVLKRLSDAVASNDPILGVINGSAVNQDGRTNGLTAPNRQAQYDVILEAIERAGILPEQISYVEAHGTGTSLGDPIEVNNLATIMGQDFAEAQPCYTGSVKSNIGHLESAAGIAGLIKVLLSMHHERIPKTLHFESLNPLISLEDTRLRIATEAIPWPKSNQPRFAGLSSFGFGGTNAHVILSSPPKIQPKKQHLHERSLHLFTLSARKESALRRTAQKLAERLRRDKGLAIGDVCYSANTGRNHFEHRLALVTDSVADLADKLEGFATEGKAQKSRQDVVKFREKPRVVFLYTGQGSQYAGMGYEFFLTEETFRDALERCNDLFMPYLNAPLLSVFYPEEHPNEEVYDVDLTQEALFSLEYALTELLASWGIKPDAVLGHSLGEYAAACAAGVFSLEDAVHIVARRKQLLAALPEKGSMTAVYASVEEIEDTLDPFKQSLSVAAVNGPRVTVISGQASSLEQFEAALSQQGIKSQNLQVRRAFHSPMLDPMLEDFGKEMARCKFQAPKLDLASGYLGRFLEKNEVPNSAYWIKQTRGTVHFQKAIEALGEAGYTVFIEVGPNPNLCNMAKRILTDDDHLWLPTLKSNRNDWRILEHSLSELYVAGYPIDWHGFDRNFDRKRVTLPGYSFDHERYWLAIEKERTAPQAQPAIAQEIPEPESKPVVPVVKVATNNADTVMTSLKDIFASLMKRDPESLDIHEPFIEMGADSIILAEAIQKVEGRYNIDIPIRMLFDETPDLSRLAEQIAATLPEEEVQPEPTHAQTQAQAPPAAQAAATMPPSEIPVVQADGLAGIMQQQLNLLQSVMNQQFEILRNNNLNPGQMQMPYVPQLSDMTQSAAKHTPEAPDQPKAEPTKPEKRSLSSKKEEHGDGEKPFVPFQPIKVGNESELSPLKQRHRQELVGKLTAKTQKSKAYTQDYRPFLADNRASVGFRLSIKEMLYPIVASQSKGAHIWDLDDNRYVDLTMGFGVNLFGHNEGFVQQAIQAQNALGMQLGPQAELAGATAKLICELTKNDRATFTNSGTEAVMTAMRLARLGTGRDKVVTFAGSYHGSFDGVLAKKSMGEESEALPMAPGVSRGISGETVVLDYGKNSALDYLEAHGDQIAAVLVEPVQSRRPDLQPIGFLKRLRQITEEKGTALIFDEIITGFRVHQAGAQEVFGIKADMTTYGKVIGGGMPIGVVAGKSRFLNGIDGGLWSFGDPSFPEAATTFFAGTFCKHPLTLAASHAVLKRMQEVGPQLQERLSEKTAYLTETLNNYFEEEHLPVRMVRFGSLFRFAFNINLDLLFYHLLEKGVYIWEGRNCFLSTAHTDEDIAHVIKAVKDSVVAMRRAGYLPQKETVLPAGTDLSTSGDTQYATNEAQKQLLFLSDLEPLSIAAYTESAAIKLNGDLNVPALRTALNQIWQRYDVLRTVFNEDHQHQRIQSAAPLPFQRIQCLDEEVDATLIHLQAQRINLHAGPLFRLSLVQSTTQQILLFEMHHLIGDGMSLMALVDDFAACYAAKLQYSKAQLPRRIPFQAFLQQQAKFLSSSEAKRDLNYWLSRFPEGIPELELPTDRPRLSTYSFHGERLQRNLTAEQTRTIKAFAASQNMTPFMLLMATFAELIHQITGQPEVVIGFPVSGRFYAENHTLIGYGAHLLPLLSRKQPKLAAADFLQNTKSAILEALDHQQLPFSELLRRGRLNDDPRSGNPIAAVFNLDKADHLPSIGAVEVETYPLTTTVAKYELSLDVLDLNGSYQLKFDYASDLFDETTIERFAQYFERLLMLQPETELNLPQPLPLMDSAELEVVLKTFNDTAVKFPTMPSLHGVIEDQAARSPEAIAVRFDQKSLSYAALNAAANQLARSLRSVGVGREHIVAVVADRNLHLPVALLAILKAGAAYLPISPEDPKDRMALLMADAQVSAVITQQHLLPMMPDYPTPILTMDGIDTNQLTHNLALPVDLNQAAYVIYTSGSTGRPKGVVNHHRGILNRLAWKQDVYRLQPDDQVLQKTAYTFDVSVWEFFWPLINGACLVMAKPGIHKDPRRLARTIENYAITTLHFVPSMLREFLSELEPRRCRSLRRVLCSGEALPNDLVQDFHRLLDAECHNLYGPTEAAIDVTALPCPFNVGEVTIGKPIANCQVYVLNTRMEPQPIGVAGELFLAGVQLARGYLNRPDLTAQTFIPHPFANQPGERLYKSGDRACFAANGEVRFLGRVDFQVKLRGFRIELGEIENRLLQYESIKNAAVLLRQDHANEAMLVAYVVSNSTQLDQAALRQYLETALPHYLVPAAFVEMDQLPLNRSGKLDRKALPAPDLSNATAYVAPRNELEEKLAGIWADVLGIAQPSIHDRFYDLGGHSLKAVRIVSRMRSQFSIEIQLREVFENPTIANFAEALHNRLLVSEKAHLPQVELVADRNQLPLSFAQQRLWLFDQLEGASPTYNMPGAMHFYGVLNVTALEKAWQKLMLRHENLRSFFPQEDGKPRVRFLDDAIIRAWRMPVMDFTDLGPSEAQGALEHFQRNMAAHIFDLTHGPLIRTELIQLADEHFVLLANMHHIISDGWSLGILMQDLAEFYNHAAGHSNIVPTPLPIQYGDYASWQQQWLTGAMLQQQLDFWQKELTELPPLSTLPPRQQRPGKMAFSGAHHHFEIDRSLKKALDEVCRDYQATQYVALLVIYATVLARHNQSQDLAIGTPVANRTMESVEALIGFFVNTLVMRVEVDEELTFARLLQKVQDRVLRAFEHQDLPFDKVVQAINPERQLSYHPLFQTMFILQNTPVDDADFKGLKTQTSMIENPVATFDLTFTIFPTADRFAIEVEYNANLYDAAQIEGFCDHFSHLLKAFVSEPNRRLQSVPLLGAAALETWKQRYAPKANYAEVTAIHHLFEAQAAKQPQQLAVISGERSTTYAELEHKANLLAQKLMALDLGNDGCIAVLDDRSVDMFAAILAVLKIGKSYLPLAPDHPADRLAHQIDISGVRVCLTRKRWRDVLAHRPLRLVMLDDCDMSQPNPGSPKVAVSQHHEAYRVFTSGSTGLPKGVMVAHSGLINAFQGWQAAYDLQAGEHHLQMAAATFDVFAGDWSRALCSGGCLVVCPRESLLAPEELHQLVTQHQVQVAEFVPAVVRHYVAYMLENDLPAPSIRLLAMGSDSLYGEEFKTFCQIFKGSRLINSYGVSEATIDSTYFEVRDGEFDAHAVPIGMPFANSEVYVVNRYMQLQPEGVIGELVLGGTGLALGYAQQPNLTAERFIPNPFSSSAGARLYRTGDKVVTQPNGQLVFLGRLDHQVKLRGHRIELGEIEAQLGKHSNVAECAVLCREDQPGQKQLVAYVEPHDMQIAETDYEAFLRDSLPNYMLPSQYVVLETLPLNQSGKIDRKALPAPQMIMRQSRPFTPTEALVADVWSEVLGTRPTTPEADFFNLGGHSLLATQVLARLRDKLNCSLPLRSVFEASNLAAFAQRLDAQRQTDQGEQNMGLPVMRQAPVEASHLLSLGQKRLWFLNQLDAKDAAYNMNATYWVEGPFDIEALSAAVNIVVARHEPLRTSFHEVDGAPQAVVHVQRPIEILRSELPQSDSEGLHQLAQTELMKPFDLANDCLIRVSVCAVAPQRHLLMVSLHHIIADGWSIDVLLRELSELYPACIQKAPHRLPVLAMHYRDYVHWQHQLTATDLMTRQIDYWRTQLADSPPLLELPTDRNRPKVQTFAGAYYWHRVSQEKTDRLEAFARSQGLTMFMLLDACFSMMLARLSGQEDLVIGTPVANRDHAQVEGLVGFFVNTLALRHDLRDNPSLIDYLARVREMHLDAFAHRHASFERVVEAVNPERQLSHTPIFQVMFVMQNTPFAADDIAGLQWRPFESKEAAAMFDLTLAAEPDANGLNCGFEYNTDLFDEATIAMMARCFEVMLDHVEQHADIPVFHLPLSKPTSVKAIEQTRPHQSLDLLKTLEQTQARHATSNAFESQASSITYHSLWQQAAALGQVLQTQNLAAGSPIGIVAERDIQTMIAMLGCLRAGFHFVPLDDKLPEQRLASIVKQAGIRVVLSLEEQDWSVHKLHNITISSAVQQGDAQTLKHHTWHPQETAYVLFTSGTTGEPKGVPINYQALSHFVHNALRLYELEATDRMLQFAPITFDTFIEETFPTLSVGGCVVLRSEEMIADPETFCRESQRWNITLWDLPTAFWQVLVQQEHTLLRHLPTSLHTIILGGERVQPQAVKQWLTLFGRRINLFNTYGPTETCVIATAINLKGLKPDQITSREVPIGRPLRNTIARVLDRRGQVLPAGVPGELAIGGPAVGQGYLGLAVETARAFVPDPVAQTPGARLYRTGDRVRLANDGQLIYFGRIDRQVKFRGFRIELQEVERTLASISGSPQVATKLWGQGAQARLIGYLVPTSSDFDAIAFRRALKEELPAFMQPSAIQPLSVMPLTSRGKVDYDRLPEVAVASDDSTVKMIRDPRLKLVLSVWQETLGLNTIAKDANFFELGGHSLLAVQIIARLRDLFDVSIGLQQFFSNPTPESVLALLNTQDTKKLNLPPMTRVSRDQPLELSYSQQRLWYAQQLEPESSAYNISGALQLEGEAHFALMEKAMGQLVERHEMLRARFVNQNGMPAMIFVDENEPLIDVETLQKGSTQTLPERQAAIEATVFDLSKDRLFRVHLLQLSEQEARLVFVMHHIIGDGYSVSLLIKEFGTLYNAFLRDQKATLEPLTVQYGDYAAWQRRFMRGSIKRDLLNYWSQQLAEPLPTTLLPLDGKRTDRPDPAGVVEQLQLDTETLEQLRAFNQKRGLTSNMTLMAVFVALLHSYGKQEDLVVGTTLAGRDLSETESLLGCLINMAALRFDLSQKPSFDSLLEQVRRVTLEAHDHGQYPFEQLIVDLNPKRGLGESPFFQITFGTQDPSDSALELDQLRLTEVPSEDTLARYDLTVWVEESAAGLKLIWTYRKALFKPETIAAMIKRYGDMLKLGLTKPEVKLFELLPSETEQKSSNKSKLKSSLLGARKQRKKLKV